MTYRDLLISFMLVLLSACANKKTVTVNSEPIGASVRESTTGQTATTNGVMTFSDDYAFLNFEIKKEGYESHFSSININPDIDYYTVAAVLKMKSTRLHITTSPPSTQCTIDCNGNSLSASNQMRIPDRWFASKDAINCHLTLMADGYQPLSESIRVVRYEERSYHKVLKLLNLTFFVTSTPSDVNVYDRKLGYLGTTPFDFTIEGDDLNRISAHRSEAISENFTLHLKFKRKGYQELTKTATINKSVKNIIRVRLNKK